MFEVATCQREISRHSNTGNLLTLIRHDQHIISPLIVIFYVSFSRKRVITILKIRLNQNTPKQISRETYAKMHQPSHHDISRICFLRSRSFTVNMTASGCWWVPPKRFCCYPRPAWEIVHAYLYLALLTWLLSKELANVGKIPILSATAILMLVKLVAVLVKLGLALIKAATKELVLA